MSEFDYDQFMAGVALMMKQFTDYLSDAVGPIIAALPNEKAEARERSRRDLDKKRRELRATRGKGRK